MKKKIILISIALLLISAAFLLRILFPGNAFFWPLIYLLPGISALIFGLIWQKKRFILPLSQIVFSICLAFSLAEIYFQKALNSTEILTYKANMDDHIIVDRNGKKLPLFSVNTLGEYRDSLTGIKPNMHGIDRRVRIFYNGSTKIVFEAEYTINFLGFRNVPFHTNTPLEPPLIFFGDSFTFGDGVNDSEVYVNLIAEKLKGQRNVYNFGKSGGSPAEMLFFLQNNVLEKAEVKPEPPGQAYYLIINDHRYRVLGNRTRVQAKTLTKRQKAEILFAYWTRMRLFYRSALFEAICSRFHRDLYITYLKEAEELLQKKYGISLTVIVYPDCMPDLIGELKQAGFRLLYLKDVMPGYIGYHTRKVDLRYEIPYDGHPTPNTHKIIADYLLKHIQQNVESNETFNKIQ